MLWSSTILVAFWGTLMSLEVVAIVFGASVGTRGMSLATIFAVIWLYIVGLVCLLFLVLSGSVVGLVASIVLIYSS